MKILHVVSGMQKASGVTTFVENVVEELRALGHEVDVLTKDNSPSSVYHLSLIDYHSYDIVHIHGLWDPWLLKIASSITTSRTSQTSQTSSSSHLPRLVWSTHGMTAPWSMRHKWWKKCLVWWLWQKPLLKRAALIHSTVEQEAEWNRALGLGVGGREIVVPLGTHLPSISMRSVNSAEGAEVRAKGYGVFAEGLPEEELPSLRTLLFIGRIYPVKALDRLIEAFARAHVPGWHLRLVGPDQSGHTAELKSLCEKLNIPYSEATKSTFRSDQIVDFTSDTIGRNADMPSGCEADGVLGIQVSPNFACAEGTCVQESPRVIFAGPKFGPELSAEYAACDILALVSHTENFGATVVDALAHGKPVITSTNTPWREVTGVPSSSGSAEGAEVRAKGYGVFAEGLPEEYPPSEASCEAGAMRGELPARSTSSSLDLDLRPRPNSCGWWVDNDVDTLTSCLRTALTTPPSTLAEMGARGRSLVESKYTWRAVASRLSTAYSSL